MKKQYLTILGLFIGSILLAQSGHVMQGVGAVNMSMGGAATAQPLDINGAIFWNPASIAAFDKKVLSLTVGTFFSSPELSSSIPAGMLGEGSPALSGTIKDELGTSIMPAVAYVWGKPESNHTFGISLFGISGFGVDFPEDTNSPLAGKLFNPKKSSSPISFPQEANGFGHVKSRYMLMQFSLTYAYSFTDNISIGIQPNFNYEALEMTPNPTSKPDFTGKGYPVADNASALGYGGQIGVFYDSHKLLKLGVSYKTKQYFNEYTFKNTYLDDSKADDNNFTMNYPSILSFGLGLSSKKFEFAADFRLVDYENTEGFDKKGWAINEDKNSQSFGYPTGAVKGFGWQNMTIISLGLQYKIMDNLPLRIGYTHNSNPIKNELAFYSVSAPAVITDAAQIGIGYKIGKLDFNLLYHKGFRGDGNKGSLLSPLLINPDTNPYGAIPGTSVSYDMETSLIQLTVNYVL